MTEIRELVNHLMPAVIGIRRALHSIPEPAYKEKKTARYISNVLKDLDIQHKFVNGTGIVAEIDTQKSGHNIAVRADMDALPIEEKTGLDFSSEHVGYMHACGHDGHMAILLGLIMTLSKLKDKLTGKIRFIFQPAEEKPPMGGAKGMITEGVLSDIDFILGYHILPSIETGKLSILSGNVMAAADEFEIKVIAKGGHASCPEKTVDTILVAAKIVDALNSIVSRMIPPFEPVVISCGEIHGGYAFNIIPDEVTIKGTVRTFNKEIRAVIPQKISNIIEGITKAFAAEFKFDYITCYPPLTNDEKTSEFMRNVASSIWGKESLVNIKPLMGSEDFSAYLEIVRGCYFFIGGAKGSDTNSYLHSSFYDFDERALKIGITTLAKAILNSSLWEPPQAT